MRAKHAFYTRVKNTSHRDIAFAMAYLARSGKTLWLTIETDNSNAQGIYNRQPKLMYNMDGMDAWRRETAKKLCVCTIKQSSAK